MRSGTGGDHHRLAAICRDPGSSAALPQDSWGFTWEDWGLVAQKWITRITRITLLEGGLLWRLCSHRDYEAASQTSQR